MIQCRSYNEAKLTAIELICYFDNNVKQINIKYDKKRKCFWVEKEEFTQEEQEEFEEFE